MPTMIPRAKWMRIKVSRVLFVLDSGEGGFPWFMFPPVGCCAYSVSYFELFWFVVGCSFRFGVR